MNRANTLILLIAMALGQASCVKKNENKPGGGPPATAVNGIYTLARGANIANGVAYRNDSVYFKSTLAFYDPATKTVTPDRFSQVNGFPLGLFAEDMGVYGAKLYIALAGNINVPGSGNVTVVDAGSTRLLGRTAFKLPDSIRYYTNYAPAPLHICFFEGAAYIGLANGTIAVMDTATLKVTRYLNPSANPLLYPVGPVVENGKLYIAGFQDGMGGNLQVVDPRTGTLIRTIAIYLGPSSISGDSFGNVYVQSQYDTTQLIFDDGTNFQGITPGITVISSATDQVLHQASGDIPGDAPITVAGNTGYYITGNYTVSTIGQFNAASLSFQLPPYSTGVGLGKVTALTADPATGQLFVGDSRFTDSPGGTVDVFAGQQLQYSFPAGTNLVRIIPLHP